MESIKVGSNSRVTLTPKSTYSYFYTRTRCVDAVGVYGGISLRINAPAGTTLLVQLASAPCGEHDTKFAAQSSVELGWTFDGTEKLYSIPLSRYTAIDNTKISTVFFGSMTNAVTFGPMSFYCGSTPTEYHAPGDDGDDDPATHTAGVAPVGTAPAVLIDQFYSQNVNAMGFWHGADSGMQATWGTNSLTLAASTPDQAFYTLVSGSCSDMRTYDGSYLHIAYSGTNKFTIALQQHNDKCDKGIAPYPETWDSLEAARYANKTDIFIPMSHFNIERSRTIGLAFKGFYSSEPVTFTKVEIVPSAGNFPIPNKLPSGNLMFACKRPNSFAFAIDDGHPEYAKEVMDTINSENIKVTFFIVGAPLKDPKTNLSNVYRDMMKQGHQIALHSYTHPRMEGLPDYSSIDWEYNEDIKVTAETFDGLKTKYFRPPFGNEGARMRQRLAVTTGSNDPYIVNWNVDVEDWRWAQSSTPEKQLEAFKNSVAKGGNLVVMHYLYPTTVKYLREFIQLAKATGKQLMRVDQCMMDPDAPPL
jgi:peptidoglycan/xylan/chitin deacetylase (PgdA/CDA1 family)